MEKALRTIIFIRPGDYVKDGQNYGHLTPEAQENFKWIIDKQIATIDDIGRKNIVIVYKRSYRGLDAAKIISDRITSFNEENSSNNITIIEADWLTTVSGPNECHDQVEQILMIHDKICPTQDSFTFIIAEIDVSHPLMTEIVQKYLNSHVSKDFFAYYDKESSGNGFRIECRTVNGQVVGTPI